MSIITPSDNALEYLQQLTIGQQRFDISEQSDTTGHTATRLGGPPRWTVALRTLDALEPAVSGLWKAIAVQMRGRVNHLALHDITQPQPRGTFRGTVTLGATSSAGATALTLAGCRGLNAVMGGSFEVDTNADGVADGWARYSNGTTGALTQFLSDGTAITSGVKSQALYAAALGVDSADRSGVYQTGVPVAHMAGQAYRAECSVAATSGTGLLLAVVFVDALGSSISGGELYASAAATGGVQYLSGTATVPANAVTASVFVYQHSGTGGAVVLFVDSVQLVAGTAAVNYPAPATLLAGDWLQIGSGVGSHYCMVMADATASDAGAMSVLVEAPTRKAWSSGTAVTWDKPKAHFKQRPDSLSWSGAAGSDMVGGFAFDLMEDWSA